MTDRNEFRNYDRLIAEARGRAGTDMGLSDQLLRELADALEYTTRHPLLATVDLNAWTTIDTDQINGDD